MLLVPVKGQFVHDGVSITERAAIGLREGGGGGGVLDRRNVLDLMLGRSRMTIDPRIPTMPGRSASGFHRPGRHLLAPSFAKRKVRCSASRLKGELHVILRTALEADFLAYGVTASIEFIYFPVWPTSRDSNGGTT